MQKYTSTIDGGSHWSFIARRHIRMKITDIDGGANVGMLFYNPNQLTEKYNAPDTLKCQHTFKLTKGNCLYSDMGRIFCSIVDDSFGWHESVCGNTHAQHITEKWGARDYQQDSNHWKQNGYDAFLTELAKYDLTAKAMVANLNFFSAVECDASGNLRFEKRSAPGDTFELRFEMDTLVLMHTCPHPLNTEQHYPERPVTVTLSEGEPASSEDYCRNFRAENKRGFMNNDLYHLGIK